MEGFKLLIEAFTIWWYLWILIILTGLYFYFIPQIRGYLGEKFVISILNKLDKSKYKLVNNIMLQIGNKTSQIDHVIVSNYGIFVLETKNYRGWIIGNEYDEYWTQVIYKRKEKMRNPIKQNWGHIQALKEVFSEYPEIKYYSIIVFTSRSDLKVKTNSDVINVTQLLTTIKKYNYECISETLKEQLLSKLTSLNVDSKAKRKTHVKTIRNTIDEKQKMIKENICPKCNGQLVIRKGKYGEFKGCNNYPKCKFIFKD